MHLLGGTPELISCSKNGLGGHHLQLIVLRKPAKTSSVLGKPQSKCRHFHLFMCSVLGFAVLHDALLVMGSDAVHGIGPSIVYGTPATLSTLPVNSTMLTDKTLKSCQQIQTHSQAITSTDCK